MRNIHITRNNVICGDRNPVEANVVPKFVGQQYIMINTNQVFFAKGTTHNDWIEASGSVDIDLSGLATKEEIDVIKEDLSKTENTKYTTINGVKEFECKDGYIDNISIEGKTLVNLNTFSERGNDDIRIWLFDLKYSFCSNDKQYTVINLSDKIITIQKILNNSWVDNDFTHVSPKSSEVINISDNKQLGGIFGVIDNGWSNTDSSYNELKKSIVILEGNHKDKPISYFEGLKSVGQGDKIDALTYNGEDSFNGEFDYGYFNTAVSDPYREELYTDAPTKTTKWIACKPNTEYHFIGGNRCSVQIKNNGSIIYFEDIHSTYYSAGIKMPFSRSFKTPNNCTHLRVYYERIDEYSTPFKIIEGNCDTKTIPVTLRSLPNGVKDTIEKRGNKYVKVQRCEEFVLTGNKITSANNIDTTSSSTILMASLKFNFDILDNVNCYCDNFKYEPKWAVDGVERIYLEPNAIALMINKNRLHSLDLEGLKRYFNEHPTTVVYELVTPQIIELPNFNPQTYEGNTTLLINSGAIQGECSFEVTNSMGSELEVLKDKLSDIDNQISGSLLALKELGGIL